MEQQQPSDLSCPRDWHLSASWGLIEATSETPHTLQDYRIDGFKRDSQLVPNYADRCQSLGQTANVRFLVWEYVERLFLMLLN